MPGLDFIIPTFNNPDLLRQTVNSLWNSLTRSTARFTRCIVVNNGSKDSLAGFIPRVDWLHVVQAPKNLGWEGGLREGLKHSQADIVVFCNDDIRAVTGDKTWVLRLLSAFNHPRIGAVGPCSNFVAGAQTIFRDESEPVVEVPFLIGFFMAVRRSALDAVGGVDDTLPGGDDIDLSIRLRDGGYSLLCHRDIFIFHHGQKTGSRVHQGYWDSNEHHQQTYYALIRKHGMLKFWETWIMGWNVVQPFHLVPYAETDVEGDVCRKHVVGDKILDLGCGGTKTVPTAVGIDLVEAGRDIPSIGVKSVADVVADVHGELPVADESQDCIIARHILEHANSVLVTLANWNMKLKVGGRLIIAAPNHTLGNTIVMNPDHKTALTPSNVGVLAVVAGYEEIGCVPNTNGCSFVLVLDKVQRPLDLLQGRKIQEAKISCAS